MKKFLLMIAAIVALCMSAVSLTSCGNDDDDNYDVIGTFTIGASADKGNLTDAEYTYLTAKLAQASKTCTNVSKTVAIAAFEVIITECSSDFQSYINDIKTSENKDVIITIWLKDANGNIVDSKKFSPTV